MAAKGFDFTRYAVGGATRPDSFTRLNPQMQDRLAAMLQAADEELGPNSLRITSAYRSPELQAKLYQSALKKYGSEAEARRWVAPSGSSQHNFGTAVDFASAKGGLLRDPNSPEARWLAANAERFGLAVPLSNEPWQVELAGARSGNITPTPKGMASTPKGTEPSGGQGEYVLADGNDARTLAQQLLMQIGTQPDEDQVTPAEAYGAAGTMAPPEAQAVAAALLEEVAPQGENVVMTTEGGGRIVEQPLTGQEGRDIEGRPIRQYSFVSPEFSTTDQGVVRRVMQGVSIQDALREARAAAAEGQTPLREKFSREGFETARQAAGGLVGGEGLTQIPESSPLYSEGGAEVSIPAPVRGVGEYLGDVLMTAAGAGQGAYGYLVGGLGDLLVESGVMDRSGAQRLARDLMAMPEAFAGSPRSIAAPRMAAGGAKPRTAPNAMQAAVKEAGDLGIPVMTTDVKPPQSFISKWITQKVPEAVPIAGTGGMRVTQQQARMQAVKDVLSEFGAGTKDEIAKAVWDDLDATRRKKVTEYAKLKSDVFEKLPKTPVDVSQTVAKIDDEISRLSALKVGSVNPVIEYLTDFKGAIQGQDIMQLEKLRSIAGEAFTNPDLSASRTIGEKSLSSIYAPLRDDMGKFIKENGDRRDFTKWKVANARLSELSGEVKKTKLGAVLKKGTETPEVVEGLIFSQKPSEVRSLYRNLSPEGRANARLALLSRAAEKAGGLDNVNPDRFAAELKRSANAAGVLITGDDAKRIEGLTRALQLTKRASEVGVSPPTGLQAMPAVMIDVVSGSFGGPSGATATMGGIGLAARVYESPAVRDLLLKISKAPKGSKSERDLANRLSEAMSRALDRIDPNLAGAGLAASSVAMSGQNE